MAAKIRVLIADDHPIFRVGLRNLISQQADMEVVGEANDGPEAIERIAALRPDITLLDLRMPGMDGPQVIAAVLAHDKDAKIVILTTYDGDEDIYRAVEAGARGYLLKDTFPEGMLDAIRDVHAGGHLFPAAVAAKLVGRGEPLSTRELSVLELLARGLSNKEIQSALSIPEGTLKNHLKRVFDKLDVTDRTQAVLVALKRGLVRLS
ncbi:MAG TPA: response regulator transcription factor [Polyangia bacterium]|nr:response regulator transcription factor [Polyangia bacterium]